MSRGAKLLLFVLVGGVVLCVATVALGAAAVYAAGSVSVDVRESSGSQLSLSVPAGLAGIAVRLVPDRLVGEMLLDLDDEIRPVIPALGQAWDEFSRAPDFVLVEVESAHEHVRIEKRQGRLLVHVDSGGERVEVALPLSMVEVIVRKLDRGADWSRSSFTG